MRTDQDHRPQNNHSIYCKEYKMHLKGETQIIKTSRQKKPEALPYRKQTHTHKNNNFKQVKKVWARKRTKAKATKIRVPFM